MALEVVFRAKESYGESLERLWAALLPQSTIVNVPEVVGAFLAAAETACISLSESDSLVCSFS